jgi:hypothetical protein
VTECKPTQPLLLQISDTVYHINKPGRFTVIGIEFHGLTPVYTVQLGTNAYQARRYELGTVQCPKCARSGNPRFVRNLCGRCVVKEEGCAG